MSETTIAQADEPAATWVAAAAGIARLLGTLSNKPVSRDAVAELIHPEAFDPPDHWTLGNVTAAQGVARRMADKVLALLSEKATAPIQTALQTEKGKD